MLKRFLLGGVLIVLLSGGATATLALNKITGIAEEVFPKQNQISAPKGVVTPEYNGGPQTFLILGSDRRVGSKDAYDRTNPPHSDTILLVRFDPEQGQTSVMSVPRDLMVNITTRNGQSYPKEKINAAYTIGNKLGGTRGGMVLAAETIEHEVAPGAAAERDRRRQLPGLHQGRGHARLRLRERGPPLLQRERRVDRKPTTRASTCSPAIRSSATRTRWTTCAIATPTRTSSASPASRTSCATCASRYPQATSSVRSTRSPRRWGTRSARPSTHPRAS